GERVGGGCEGGGGRGAGTGTRGCGSQLHPRADPGATPPATKGWPWSGHRGTRKREKPVARWTGAFLLLASALARHTPSFGGTGKERGKPQARPNLGLRSHGSMTIEYARGRRVGHKGVYARLRRAMGAPTNASLATQCSTAHRRAHRSCAPRMMRWARRCKVLVVKPAWWSAPLARRRRA